MTTDLLTNLAEAWLERAKSAAADLSHADKAPALFKPEFIAQREAEMVAAMQQCNYWRQQATS